MADWAALAAELQKESDQHAAEERRSFGRDSAPQGARIILRASPAAEPMAATLLDLSITGAGLGTPQALPIDAFILMDLQWTERRHLVLARVAHCAPGGSGYKLGLEFEDEIALHEGEDTVPDQWLSHFKQ